MISPPVDLICVGGGIAGLVAGLRAAERGLRVTVLEKGTDPRYPCNARWSGGILHIAYTDPKDAAETLRAAIARNTEGATDPELAEVLVQHVSPTIDWLRDQGARFIRAGLATWQNWMLAPPRPLVGGIDWQGRGPDVLLRLLGEKLVARGATLRLGARAVALRMDGARCIGVELEGGEFLHARAVVIADGGFQSSLSLLRDHITAQPEKIKQRGAGTGMGDGLVMALAAGAAVTELDKFYGHLLSRDAIFGNDKVWPYPELDGVATAGVLVNEAGARFTDEGLGGIAMANALARSENPLGATVICDSAIWEGPGKSARIPANPQVERGGGTIHRADTLATLAAKAGLPVAALEQTIAAYNAAVAGQGLAFLSPGRADKKYKPMPVLRAPFLAIPVCAGITYTMGGLAIDLHARVKHRDGGVIKGLYAAGSTTGGIEGGPLAGYIGGLSKAATFGFRAAEHVANVVQHGEKT
ncbi:MAG: FAD-dependent oxidoreductase [Acetobacteraceae bacterium]|nr:FAD-dependent oxidoreductase [Acetobacteraceae bacterium]